MNKVILMGFLGQDPKITTFQDGNKIANVSLATSEKWKDKQGNRQESTEWHNLVFRGGQAEVAEKWLTKGMQLLVTGKIKTRTWKDKEGNNRYIQEIIVTSFEFVGNAGSNTNESPKPKPDQEPKQIEDTEDDLPF